MLKKIFKALLILVAIGFVVLFGFVPTYTDKSMNKVTAKYTDTPDQDYSTLPFIADLHCDMLLWDRNFLDEHDYGHVDLPRMQKANMAFQIFTIVSKTPRGINIEQNSDETDQIALLSFAQLRPPSNWFSIKARALNQCKELYEAAEDSDGAFRVVSSQNELRQFITDRAADRSLTAGMLGLEGAHCLEGDINNLKTFYDAGVRYIGLTHFFDNEWAGSAHGMKKEGLTGIGKQLVEKMGEMNMIIDLAHSSSQTIDDVFALTDRPVIISHTGVKGMCDNQRNLSDKHLMEIGKRNGLVGIGLWETAVCGNDAIATANSIRYVADMIGVDKVTLGSDFDGALTTHFDATGLPLIMEALKKDSFTSQEIELIMGGNVRNFLLKNLPAN
ncbi:MAG: dipeptidase [Cyclobacteriaceae bacterium]